MENEHQNTICCADKSNLRSYDVSRFSFQSKVRGDGAEYHDDDDDEDDMLTSNTSEMFCADSILFFLAPTTSMDSVNSVQRCGANSLDSSWPELGHILVWDTCTQARHVSRAVNRTSRSYSEPQHSPQWSSWARWTAPWPGSSSAGWARSSSAGSCSREG